MRPSLRRSPSEAVPISRLAATSGTTTIVIRRMKAVPTGSTMTSVVCSQSSANTFAIRPMTMPRARPMRIFVWSCIARLYSVVDEVTWLIFSQASRKLANVGGQGEMWGADRGPPEQIREGPQSNGCGPRAFLSISCRTAAGLLMLLLLLLRTRGSAVQDERHHQVHLVFDHLAAVDADLLLLDPGAAHVAQRIAGAC